ncbi:hypothetical protein Brsp07_04327 [Brucella sp. NBRC 14130]
MTKHILIVGAGFAGVMAALAASRLRHEKGVSAESLKISVVSPAPELVIRPRLYEPHPEKMTAPLGELFEATEIEFVPATVERIDAANNRVTVLDDRGQSSSLPPMTGSSLLPVVAAFNHQFLVSPNMALRPTISRKR